ncbi:MULTISPECIES: hypothetical protein [unclassified Streptomyces]|uniref:hypothetical protein n=1 Tax=unclassified Streptomyces TaxID=2593676 RepID=UPI000DC5E921|nr:MULTISPECIES: hypothetical protein [unclassified Streptomyces]MYT70033.1 hypothetical protein [Streptomyces sp. SID8367]RAJ88606.1 hypothetical protein K377_02062 [Streptomyces sp. PsTaAH-137]
MHTILFLLEGALGFGSALVFAWELNRQASGRGWRKARVLAAAVVGFFAALLAAYS